MDKASICSSGDDGTRGFEARTAPPATPEALLALLEEVGISYSMHPHPPIFPVAEGESFKAAIPGLHCRNLFLKDKKDALFLVVCANETAVDLKALPGQLGSARLSFGSPERLWAHLGVRPGSVCPFALINDHNQRVVPVLDRYMMRADRVVYHPLINDKSIGLTPADLLRFLEITGHTPRIMDLS
ncbi:MAG TPA: prolyl-tRNA synthetase associated domain-containing protein [Alphaproteobacteria bacterium]|nr:prolyl-tRNA synthetase associated domain-containing protein [Alphaproteobacteria bacterium]